MDFGSSETWRWIWLGAAVAFTVGEIAVAGSFFLLPFAAGALAATDVRHANAGEPGSPIIPGAEYAADLARARRLAPLAAELGLEGTLELALRFALSRPGISTVLVGYSDLAQLESALRWAERGPLPAEAVERIIRSET